MTDHDLVLHAGMSRGSDVVAPALQRLRPQLRAHGVAYVDGSAIERLPNVSGWDRDGRAARKPAAAFARELASLARAEQRLAGGLWRRRPVPVVIAGNAMLGVGDVGRRDSEQLRPQAAKVLGQVIEAMSARSVQVVLHTHRQDRLVELAYLRWLRAGHDGAVEEFFPALCEPVLDFRDLVSRVRAIPQVSDVVVRPIETSDAGVQAFMNDLLGLIGLRDMIDLYAIGRDLFTYPRVYSTRGVDLARAMNPLVRGSEFTLVQNFLTQRYSAQIEFGPPDVLAGDVRDRILDSYAELNRALFRDLMPDLPADSYTDDSATFALGNVLRQPAPYERTVSGRIAMAAAMRTTRASERLVRSGRGVVRRLPPPLRQRLRRLV